MIKLTNKKIRIFLIAVCTLMVTSFLRAQDNSDNYIANVYRVVAKPGHADALAKAIKSHGDYRKKMKDSRDWNIYKPVTGDNLNVFFIRSCCFNWGDQDSYASWAMKAKTYADWQKRAGPHIKYIGHHMSKVDLKNSHWKEGTTFKFIGLTSYKVKMGHGQAMEKDKKLLSDAAKAQKWPYQWSWGSSMDGEFTLSLAVPYSNFASMKPPEQSFGAILAKELGSKEKAAEVLERWIGHFSVINYDIYQLTDL